MSQEYMFFAGNSHPELAAAISNELGVPTGNMTLSKFQCGENYASINETVRGRDAYILQSVGPNTNDDLMELFLIMDTLKRCSANTVNVIMPYFAYSRQDKKSAPREPISARLIADLLEAVGLNRLITMDLHADQIQGFFSHPVDHLTAMPLFIDYFKKKQLPNLVVVAPDTGRAKFAKKLGDKLGADLAIMHKTRPQHNHAEITNIVGDVNGKTVLLVDDMIDTGGSITSGLQVLKEHGANDDMYIATTHPIFSGPAVDRLKSSGVKEVVVTDTVYLPTDKKFEGLTVLSTGKMFAETITRNVEHRSISSLFEGG